MSKKRLVIPHKAYLSNSDGTLLEVFEDNTVIDVIDGVIVSKVATLNKSKPFNKFMLDQTDNLLKYLNYNEIGRLVIIAKYARYSSCILAHSNGKVLTKECIAKIFSDNVRTIERLLNTFVAKEILKKDCINGTKFYRLNPFIIARGFAVHMDVYDMFKSTKWFQSDCFRKGVHDN